MELTDTEQFADQTFTDKDFFSSPFNLAGGADPTDLVVGVVPRVLQACRPLPERGPVVLRGRRLAQRLMGTLVVEIVAEAIKALLLLGDGRGRRR